MTQTNEQALEWALAVEHDTAYCEGFKSGWNAAPDCRDEDHERLSLEIERRNGKKPVKKHCNIKPSIADRKRAKAIIRKALTRPAVDVEALRLGPKTMGNMMSDESLCVVINHNDKVKYWNECIDHLASQGYLSPPQDTEGVDVLFNQAREALYWLKQTAEDKQDFARIVGYEDALRHFAPIEQNHLTTKPEPQPVEIEGLLKLAIEALGLNHDYHQKHDEYDDYGDCELCEKNMRALAELKAYQSLCAGKDGA